MSDSPTPPGEAAKTLFESLQTAIGINTTALLASGAPLIASLWLFSGYVPDPSVWTFRPPVLALADLLSYLALPGSTPSALQAWLVARQTPVWIALVLAAIVLTSDRFAAAASGRQGLAIGCLLLACSASENLSPVAVFLGLEGALVVVAAGCDLLASRGAGTFDPADTFARFMAGPVLLVLLSAISPLLLLASLVSAKQAHRPPHMPCGEGHALARRIDELPNVPVKDAPVHEVMAIVIAASGLSAAGQEQVSRTLLNRPSRAVQEHRADRLRARD